MDARQIPDTAVSVTPSDAAQDTYGLGFMVGVAGNVALETATGATVVLPACAAGVQYAIRFNKVRSTSTTATGIVVFR